MQKIKKFKHLTKIIVILLLIIVVMAISASYYFYLKYSNLNSKNSTAKEQVIKVTKDIGKLILLPKGTPEMATVTDIGKLKEQPFFANALNNDVVLIYKDAQRVYLYRPSIKKLINVSILESNLNATNSATNTLTPTPKIYNVALYNGTNITGLTLRIASKLESLSKDYKISIRQDASKKDYTNTIVVDISGTNNDAAQRLAGLLNGKVGSLPSGETTPQGVELLVVLSGE